MSFSLPTDIGTSQANIAIVKDGNQGKLAGVPLHFATFAAYAAALAAEQGNTATSLIWVDGTSLSNGSEVGVTRKWNRAALHARKVQIGSGFVYTQAADTNQVWIGTGVPSSGIGANGDLSYDQAAATVYLKTAGAWAIYATIGAVSGAIPVTTFTPGAIPFNRSFDWGVLSVVGAVAFLPDTTGAFTNGGGVVTLVADGSHVPTFGGGLKPLSAAAGAYVNVSGVYNDIVFNKTGSGYVYAISQPGYSASTASPLTIVSAQVANSSPSVLQVTFARNLDPAFVPPASAFAVGGHASGTPAVTVVGAVALVPLATPFVNGEAGRTFVYTAPGTNGLRDADGVVAPTSAAVAITNNVLAPVGTISATTLQTYDGITIDLSTPVQQDWIVETKGIGIQVRAGSLGTAFTRTVSGASLESNYDQNGYNSGNTFYWSDGTPNTVRDSNSPGYQLNGTANRYNWDNSANPMKVGMSANLVNTASHKMRISMSGEGMGNDNICRATWVIRISDNPTPIYVPAAMIGHGYQEFRSTIEVTAQAATANATLTVQLQSQGTYADQAGVTQQLGTLNKMSPVMVSLA